MKIDLNLDITLTKAQQEIYDISAMNKYRYIILNWSRQSGKSILAKILCIKWLVMKEQYIGYVTPNFVLAKKIYNDIYTLLKDSKLVKKANAQDLIITTITNSTLHFFSSESAVSIRGNTFTKLIIDECAFCKEMINGENLWWNILYPTTKVKCTKVFVISTPNGKSGIFYDFYCKAKNNESKYYLSEKSIYDDELITENEIEELKKSYPQLAFQQEFEVKFLDSAITALPSFEKQFTDYKDEINGKIFFGVDLSANGNDLTVCTAINEKGYTKQYFINGDLDSKYKQIAELINHTPTLVKCYIEKNGIGDVIINEIRKLVHHKNKIEEFTTTNESKNEIINLLAVNIQNGDIWFNNSNTELYSEFGTFIYKLSKTRKMQYEAKSGAKDDAVMSLAIANKCKYDYLKRTSFSYYCSRK